MPPLCAFAHRPNLRCAFSAATTLPSSSTSLILPCFGFSPIPSIRFPLQSSSAGLHSCSKATTRDSASFSALIELFQDLSRVQSLAATKSLHGLTITMGSNLTQPTIFLHNNIIYSCDTSSSVVESNVIASIYNRTGEFYKTQELFALLEEPDIISWNILIAACSRIGYYKEAFELFEHMQKSKLRPDNYTFVSLLSVCTQLCNLALGSSLHGLIIKTDFSRCDTFVYNILIDMYGKCGSLTSSVKIFDETVNRNLISWTAIVSALGLHGYGHEAIQKFREMEFNVFKPDKVAFIAVLSACRHGGLVKEGMEIFEQMKSKYGIEPEMEHYHNAVDLLARYGHLKEAENLISQMPFPPNAMIWRSFLEGCKKKRTTKTLAPLAIAV